MAKNSDVGIYQMKNGNWYYRITMKKDANGNKVDTTCRVDDNDNQFLTKRSAKVARDAKLVELRTPQEKIQIKEYKLCEVWERYIKNGTAAKASATVRKQKSMWNNHISQAFGNKNLSEIDTAMLNDYLSNLYIYGDHYNNFSASYAYKYVESFLKFFYLLFGLAYSYEKIDNKKYTKMFIDENTKIKMPKKLQVDEEKDQLGAMVYDKKDIRRLYEIFERGNLLTAFLLGYFLGIRVSECFALRWQNINWSKKTITINRQMQYENNCFYLGAVKTLASIREIDMPSVLQNHLYSVYGKEQEQRSELGKSYRDNEIVMLKMKPGQEEILTVYERDFINRKENGELLTINSLKYWSKLIKQKSGINFKYHNLRHTHATEMAALNTPALELMNRLGHKKYETTMKYYINSNKLARQATLENLDKIGIMSRCITLPNNLKMSSILSEVLKEEYSEKEARTPRKAD